MRMSASVRRSRIGVTASTAAVVLACALFMPRKVTAQPTSDELEILRLEATPIGALPPIALPMPASRNHSYWGFRLQEGHREGESGSDLSAFAGGIDFQWRGGSVFGITAGHQAPDCEVAGSNCSGHNFFGARSRLNIVTGGQAINSLIHDNSASTTLGAEVGFGYAPNVVSSVDACTLDFGAPLSIAMMQTIRLVTFVTPGVVWDLGCSAGSPTRPNYLTGFGVGVQQIWHRGLDVYFGLQKIFRNDTGYQLGISVTYVRLP